MPSEPAVLVQGLGKRYKLYRKPIHRLLEWLSLGRYRRYDEHWALREIGFTIARGETFGIIGRNGAGKSTLLALLAGVLTPSEGRIAVIGRVSAILHLGAAFNADLSGAENIIHLATLAGITSERARHQLEGIASFADLGEFLHRPVKTYSAGMQLRLAFAVAIWERPDVLVVDEVLAVGDFFFRQKCHQKIQELISLGTTVILVSHDYSEVSQFCRRALLLDRGRAVFLGDAKEAVTRYLMLERHGDANRTSVQAQVDNIPDEAAALSWPAPEHQIDVNGCSWQGEHHARITFIAICDDSLRQTRVFEQGECACFFVEIEAERPLEVPVVTIMIHDAKGQMVHGVSTDQRLQEPPPSLAAGERLRIRIEIGLGLRYGEYTFDAAISDIPSNIYAQRRALTFEAMGGHTRLIGRLSNVAIFAVIPRLESDTVQLTHHGLVDLPGSMVMHKSKA